MLKIPNKPYQIFFETLGNKTRWDIVHVLLVGPLNATKIAKKLDYEQSLIAHHLHRLETCGFVTVEITGRERIYKLNCKTIRPVLKLMNKHIRSYHTYCAKNNGQKNRRTK